MPTIFILEEDPAVRDSLTALVQAFGYKGRAYADAKAFLAAPERRERGCLLLGWPQPEECAVLVRQLTKQGSTLPVAALIARDDKQTSHKALKLDAVAAVPKPFDEAALFDAIDSALGST